MDVRLTPASGDQAAERLLGIPATARFGVDYEGLHATDERIRLDTIPAVQAAYQHASLSLFTTPSS